MDRLIIVEALDPLGNKVCDLYDSTCSFPGQITNIKIQYDKKELTTLSFTLPTKIIDAETGALIDNPRWKYMTNEYQIRYSEDGAEDIFIIKSPEETNTGVKITENVTCLHRATRLKTRNIASSREGFVGNAKQHLEKILENTGWKCGTVDNFYEETLYEKYFDVNTSIMAAPTDASFGAYAEIRRATGASAFHEMTGWRSAEVIITSIGKNLCDGMIEKGGLDEETGLPAYNTSTTRYRSINYLYVKPFRGATMVLSGENVGGVVWHAYDENKNLLSSFQTDMTLTIDPDYSYIKYELLANNVGDESFISPPSDVQIEVGLRSTVFSDYSTPYSISFALGEYDSIDRNRIIRKTVFNGTEVSEASKETIEYIPVYSIKMYDGGWIYAENKGIGGIDATFAYSVTPEVGGALREKYRYVGKESGTSAYEEIMNLEEIFGGRAVFHGDTMTVDFFRFAGRDTKFAFKPKYNTKSIKRTRSSNEFITRLYVIDQQSESGYIGIEDVNPTGMNFIMNFDHFELSEKQQEAIDDFTDWMKSTQHVSKYATDAYVKYSNQINGLVGQTPMGTANITGLNDRYVYIDTSKIYSYKEKAKPEAGDIVYIRGEDGIWQKYEVEAFYAGINAIYLTKPAPSGSIVWWMSSIPAGTVGAQIITLNTYQERLANYEAQLAVLVGKINPTDAEKEKIEELRENIKTTKVKIDETSNGTLTTPGLNAGFALLVGLTEKYNDAVERLESYAEKRRFAVKELDEKLGDIVYEGVFPQGEYASGQELELYEDALKYLEEHAHPQAEYSVTAIERTVYGDEYKLEDIRFGDIVYVDDEELGISNLPAEITSYTDEPLKRSSNSFKLGNFAQNPIELFEQIIDASKTIADSKYRYDKLISIVMPDGTISREVLERSIGDLSTSSKDEIEQMIKAYLTTDVLNNAGVNWSQVGLLNNEITLRADQAASDVLAADIITADRIAAGAIEAYHIKSNTIDADKIKAGSITGDRIAAKTITASQLRSGLITATSGLIAIGAIQNAQIADGSITAAKIVSLNADVIESGTLKTDRLLLVGEGGVVYEINAKSSGLTQTELSKEEYQNKLNGTVIVAKSITADQIAAKALTANEIAANTITAAEIDVANLFASEATIAEINTMDIRGNKYLQMAVNDIEVGGRNLIRNSRHMGFEDYLFDEDDTVAILDGATLDRMILGG